VGGQADEEMTDGLGRIHGILGYDPLPVGGVGMLWSFFVQSIPLSKLLNVIQRIAVSIRVPFPHAHIKCQYCHRCN